MCKCLHVILLCSYLLVEADIEFAIRKPRWMNKWVRDNLSQCPSLSLSLLVPLTLCNILLYHSPPPSAPPKFLVYRSTPNGRWVRGSLETKMIKEILDLWVGGRWGARHHSHLSSLLSQQVLSDSCDPVDYNPPYSLSMEFARQEYWSGLPVPPPGISLTQGWNPHLLHWQVGSFPLSHQGSPITAFTWGLPTLALPLLLRMKYAKST